MLIVYNSRSGTADKMGEVRAFCKEHKIDAEFIAITDKQLGRKIAAIANQPRAVIVAAGGDGTVSSIAARLVGTKCAFGILPLGTLNHFAKDLGIPLDIPGAMRVITHGKATPVDTAQVNGNAFINNSSIGLYPRSLRTRHTHQKQIGKWPAAVVGVAKALWRPRRYRVEMTVHGNVRTFRTPFVFIGNNPYDFTPAGFANRKTLSSGQLAVYVVKAQQPLSIAKVFITALFSSKRRTKEFEMFLVQGCTIRTRKRRMIAVARDGEVDRRQTPLQYKSAPKSLRVMAARMPSK